MGAFKRMYAEDWQSACAKAVKKMDSVALVANTLKPGETALIEESLLKAVQTLAAWGEQ